MLSLAAYFKVRRKFQPLHAVPYLVSNQRPASLVIQTQHKERGREATDTSKDDVSSLERATKVS